MSPTHCTEFAVECRALQVMKHYSEKQHFIDKYCPTSYAKQI
uniref:Uncharacterized protein n=1 Tax=Anguilla anguilla TaxID=7936 RepID=A0A0E9WJ43_ANGAN